MRKLAVFAVVSVMVLSLAAPAAADHGEDVDGLWWAVDRDTGGNGDGSFMLLRITEKRNGDFRVTLTDFWASAGCDPAAPIRLRSSTGELVGNVLTVDYDRIRCVDDAEPWASDVTITYTLEGNTLLDEVVVVDPNDIRNVRWHHIWG